MCKKSKICHVRTSRGIFPTACFLYNSEEVDMLGWDEVALAYTRGVQEFSRCARNCHYALRHNAGAYKDMAIPADSRTARLSHHLGEVNRDLLSERGAPHKRQPRPLAEIDGPIPVGRPFGRQHS